MLLYDILKNVEYKTVQGGNAEIDNITIDSRKVTPGSLFICRKGYKDDGHDYMQNAVAAGASAILCEWTPSNIDKSVVIITVQSTRHILGTVAANFYENPAGQMKIIGVTGTKGKTSVTYYVEEALKYCKKKTGVIGTTGAWTGDGRIDVAFTTSTTPDVIELQQIFKHMTVAQDKYCVMEVSSHALALERVNGVNYEIGIFTNFAQDHLDFHITMEEYLKAKMKLFSICKKGVVNIDDDAAGQIIESSSCEIFTYGIENAADYKAEDIQLNYNGVRFSVYVRGQKIDFSVPVPGLFTVYNILAVIAACDQLGLDINDLREGIMRIKGVPGRFQGVENDREISIIVDYAHTPNSLESIIKAVRGFTKGKVITVFGCGGDRDKLKRPVMGEIAGNLSDYCYITSDNPRSENPQTIIGQIEVGIKMTACGYETIPDRRSAIEKAILSAKKGDSVIIAGKGHETYQEYENGRRIHFDDMEVASEILKQNK